MGRPPTKEFKRPALNKFGRKKAKPEIDEDLEEIVAPDEDADDEEYEEEQDEEEEEIVEKKPALRYGPKSKFKPQARVEEPEEDEIDEDEQEEEEVKVKPSKKVAPKPKFKPRAKVKVEVDEDEDEEDSGEDEDDAEESEDQEYDEENYDEGDEEKKPRGPSWLTILILVVIAGLFAAFIKLPILFFTNNPVLGLIAVLVIVACVVSYLRTDAEERDSFFLSGPGLLTLGALLCLGLGGLSEFNKEKQRVADEIEAAQLEKDKQERETAAKAKAQATAGAQPVFTPNAGSQSVTHGKWTITQDDRGAYRVNGKKVTGTWKLKDDNEQLQYLSEEEKTEIREALNKFDVLNHKSDTQQ
jgi:hypothetical protein